MLLFSGETNEKNVSLGSCDVRLHRGISQRIYLVQKKIYMTVFFLFLPAVRVLVNLNTCFIANQ